MADKNTIPAYSIDVNDKVFDELHVNVSGKIFMDNAGEFYREIGQLMKSEPLKNLVIDLTGIEYVDASAAAALAEINKNCEDRQNHLHVVNVPKRIKSVLGVFEKDLHHGRGVLSGRPSEGIIEQIGGGLIDFLNNGKEIIAFIGSVTIALGRDFSNVRSVKWDRIWRLLETTGTDAVPIATILSFLMGGILAFQAAVQLRKFGANIYVADLVSVSICLEMGPLLTALIVAGRSGAAFAAYIGTMQVTEETDALRVMGIDPVRYLVSPRIIAVAFMLPCLTLFADIVGVIGGCLVSQFSLDLAPSAYFNQVNRVLEVSDIVKGLIKSFAYGTEIALIGCLKGFQVRGGAEGVGNATTSAVVTCIFVITVTDAVFSGLYYYLPFI